MTVDRSRLVLIAVITFFAAGTVLMSALLYFYLAGPGARDEGADDSIEYLSSYYGGRRAANLLTAPIGVAVDRSGRVFVTDPDKHVIESFAPGGMLVARFPRERSNPRLVAPVYLAVDSKSRLYVTDRVTGKIAIFTSEGRFIKYFKWAMSGRKDVAPVAVGIAFDADDRMYITDVTRHRVVVATLDGRIVRTIGRYGDGKGEMNFPNGIEVDAKRVYVADSNNGRVHVFDKKSGRLLKTITAGSLPRGVALDSRGSLYVADTLGHIVRVYDGSTFRYVRQFGDFGEGDGHFAFPSGIAIRQGRAYVTDRDNHRVQVWRVP